MENRYLRIPLKELTDKEIYKLGELFNRLDQVHEFFKYRNLKERDRYCMVITYYENFKQVSILFTDITDKTRDILVSKQDIFLLATLHQLDDNFLVNYFNKLRNQQNS